MENGSVRVRFAKCLFDSDRHELTCDGEVKALPPKAFQLLESLVRSHPAAVPKTALYEQLWPGLFVEEGNLHNLIADVRGAIGDSEHTIIRTVHRVGYALAADLTRDDPCVARLVIGSREWPLTEGETVIGRDLLGTPDVSRRHACIAVHGPTALVRDLGSKNGTFVHGHRIGEDTAVASGDEIVFGMTRAVIVLHESEGTTITAAPLIENRGSARDR